MSVFVKFVHSLSEKHRIALMISNIVNMGQCRGVTLEIIWHPCSFLLFSF